MFSFTDVLDLLVNELSGLSRGRLTFPLVLARPFYGLLFGHTTPLKSTIDVGSADIVGCLSLMLVLSKILIAISLAGLLRCSEKFRRMGRELDELAFVALKRIMRASEDSGFPPHLVPLLMLLTALCYMATTYLTVPGAR